MAVVGAISKCCMRRVGIVCDAQNLPSVNVIMSNGSVVGSISRVISLVANDSHGFDTDDALQGQVGLVPKPVVRI